MEEGTSYEYILVKHGFSIIQIDLFKTKMPTPQSRQRKLVYRQFMLNNASSVIPVTGSSSAIHSLAHTHA